MIRYTLLRHRLDKDAFIQELMHLGVLHIHTLQRENDPVTEELSTLIRETEEIIRKFKQRKVSREEFIPEERHPSLNEISAMELQLEKARNAAEALAIEIRMLEPWGDFNRADIRKLEHQTGLEAKFFEYPERHFLPEWEQQFPMQIINRAKGNLYFILFKKPGDELPIAPSALPEESLSELVGKQRQHQQRVDELNRRFDYYASSLSNVLSHRLAEARDKLSYHLANTSATPVHNQELFLVHAWCPADAEPQLLKFLDETRTVYTRSLPTENDRPPVLLRNNWFARLFEPIGAMFSLPDYGELDLTPLFAPFFLLFFGLCLGDAGYGILIVCIATVIKLRKDKAWRDYATLGQLFGLATIVAGIFSGTFFGMEMIKLPVVNRLSVLFLNQDQFFNLALAIGFVQILFGMGVQAYKQWRFLGPIYAVSRLSWMVLLLCLVDVYVFTWLPDITGVLMWVALAGIAFFGAPERGWIQSFGLGLADLYNITGLLGDLLSYIRLFALGVASAILGLVVNSIALSMKEISYVGVILFIVVLIIGHTLNFLLSVLSSFVHPMRLTFVEFYKNSGFNGGGQPFTPFMRNTMKSTTKL